jgi:hypothetical protein
VVPGKDQALERSGAQGELLEGAALQLERLQVRTRGRHGLHAFARDRPAAMSRAID